MIVLKSTSKHHQKYTCSGVLRLKVKWNFFSDESGCLATYSSWDSTDEAFGLMDAWEDLQDSTSGDGFSLILDADVILNVIERMEVSVWNLKPYCRVAIVLLNTGGTFCARVDCGLAEELLCIILPAAGLPVNLQNMHALENSEKRKTYPCPVGLFIWCNRHYHKLYPPPADIEVASFAWAHRVCRKPQLIKWFLDSFERACPTDIRSTVEVAHIFAAC